MDLWVYLYRISTTNIKLKSISQIEQKTSYSNHGRLANDNREIGEEELAGQTSRDYHTEVSVL